MTDFGKTWRMDKNSLGSERPAVWKINLNTSHCLHELDKNSVAGQVSFKSINFHVQFKIVAKLSD